MTPYWMFSLKQGVWGKVDDRPGKGRWITWDAPWTEDVKEYGCPQGVSYFGKRLCVSFRFERGGYQIYDWKKCYWSERRRWLSIYPANHRERFENKYGKYAYVKVTKDGITRTIAYKDHPGM